MLFTESDYFRKPGHCSVGIGQLTKYPAGLESGEAHKVDRRFRMTAPLKNTAGAGA